MNLHSTRPDLEEAVAVARVTGDDEFTYKGRRVRTSSRPLVLRPAAAGPGPGGGVAPRVVLELANDLYLQHYTRQGALPPILPDATFVDEFCLRLSAANTGLGYVSEGWRRLLSTGDRLLVEDPAGVRRTVPADHFSGPGERGSIRRPKDSYRREPVFYYAFSDYEPPGAAFDQAVRAYFAVAACGAPALVRSVTSRFNAERVPFRFKVLRDPQRYQRADRSVLYVRPEDWARAVPLVALVWRDVRRYLVDKTPPFTRRLAPGLAVAQSPAAPGESFGTHRCRAIADGLHAAWRDGLTSDADVLEKVLQRFAAERIDADYLYLREGCDDPF